MGFIYFIFPRTHALRSLLVWRNWIAHPTSIATSKQVSMHEAHREVVGSSPTSSECDTLLLMERLLYAPQHYPLTPKKLI